MRISLILMAFMIVSVSAFAEDWTCCYIECPDEKRGIHPEYCACYCDVEPDDPECPKCGDAEIEACGNYACPDTEDRCTLVFDSDSTDSSCQCCGKGVIQLCNLQGGTLDKNCHCCVSICPDKEGYTVTLRDGICQYSKTKTCTAKTTSDGTIIPGTEVCQ